MRLAALTLAFVCAGACRPTMRDDAAPRPAPSEREASAASVAPPAAPSVSLPDVRTDWCLQGWRGLDASTCYFVPPIDAGAVRQRLLIYLSGIVPDTATSPQKENVQRVVAAAAGRAGAFAILPRGRRGIGPRDAKDWWAWPTSPADYATYARAMVGEFMAARTTLEHALGRPFERTYLAGSSSGAYFVAALALDGALVASEASGGAHKDALDVAGFAATSGGATGLGPQRSGAAKRPFYVGYALGDPTNGGPKALAEFLSASRWPVRAAAHAGGHGAREEYLDEAFAFWTAFDVDAGRY